MPDSPGRPGLPGLELPGVVGGRYRPERLLAASGMADVYAAHDERLDRPVALKFLRADGPTDAARFRREMTTVAQLEHPGLVRLYDADVLGTRPYLVLELVDGPSLAAHLAQRSRPLDADEAARILVDVAGALAHVHERGIVHRDVKPSNVLLDPEGGARLTDFGIARTTDATAMTGTAMTIGTAAYLAPEQARGDDVTSAADVYSLGLVLLECRTGVRAFPGAPIESAVARLSRDPDIPASLEPDWRALLSAMTARDPSARPTAAELAASLPTDRDAAATVPMSAAGTATASAWTSTAPTATTVLPEPRRRARSRALVTALTLAALLVVGAIGLALARGDDRPSSDAVRGPVTTTSTSAPPTTAPTTTSPPAPTSPPVATPPQGATTPRPAVVAASDCSAYEAQKKALDDQKKATDGPGGDKVAARVLEDRKHQLDDALKACRR